MYIFTRASDLADVEIRACFEGGKYGVDDSECDWELDSLWG